MTTPGTETAVTVGVAPTPWADTPGTGNPCVYGHDKTLLSPTPAPPLPHPTHIKKCRQTGASIPLWGWMHLLSSFPNSIHLPSSPFPLFCNFPLTYFPSHSFPPYPFPFFLFSAFWCYNHFHSKFPAKSDTGVLQASFQWMEIWASHMPLSSSDFCDAR